MEGIFFFALALAGFAYVLFRPEWGAPYLAFVTYARLSDVLHVQYGVPSLFKLTAPVLVIAAVGRWLVTGEPVGRGWRPALWMLALYGAVCTGSFLYVIEPERTREALVTYAEGTLIVLIMTLYLRTPLDLTRSLWAIVLSGLFLGSLTVYQQLTGSFESDFAGFSRVELRNIYSRSSGYRSEGPVSANYYAMILVCIAPLAIDRLLHDRRTWARIVAATSLAVTLASIGFTYSRGAIVALVAVAVPMVIWIPRHRRVRVLATLGATVGLAAVFMMPAEYMQRLGALSQLADVAKGKIPQDSALRGRLSEATSALSMFADHPVVGVGYGNFEIYYSGYAQKIALDARDGRQAHSLYLEIAAETGIVGILSFCTVIGFVFYAILKTRRAFEEHGPSDALDSITAFGISFVGFLAGSIFLHLSYPRYFFLMLGIGFGAGQLISRNERLPQPITQPLLVEVATCESRS